MASKALTTKEENLPAEQPKSIARLAGALAKAQQSCKAAVKDSRNSFHRYKYASAEAVITEAKEALKDCALAVLPLETTLNGGTGNWELVRKFLLVHDSGEGMPLLVAWPVVPDKGRPLDKAVAIAATASLGYLLRDLLLMPRVDQSDDLAGTSSSGEADQPQQQEPESTTPKPPARIDEAQQSELSALIRDTGTDVAKVLAHYRLRILAQLPASEYEGLRQVLLAKKQPPAQPGCITADQFKVLERWFLANKVPGTTWLQFLGLTRFGEMPAAWFHWVRLMAEQGADPGILDRVMGVKKFPELAAAQVEQLTIQKLRDKIDSLVFSDLKIDAPAFKARVKELYGTDDPGTLNVDQLVDLETKLEGVKAQRKP